MEYLNETMKKSRNPEISDDVNRPGKSIGTSCSRAPDEGRQDSFVIKIISPKCIYIYIEM